jgi:Tol biopolymer transport system component
VDGDRKPFPFLQTPFNETVARFSPDGHWVAFVSNETGRDEIYVTRFDQPGVKWRVSTSGGTTPCWRRDGKELFFLAPDKHLMTVSVKAGDTFQASAPAPLFRNDSVVQDAFDVTADGQRFVFNVSATQTQTIPFTVVVHWTADLKP